MIVNGKIRVGATKRGDFSSFSLFFKSPGAGGVTCPPALRRKEQFYAPNKGKDI